MADRSIWIGYEPRELDAFMVAVNSINFHLTNYVHIHSIRLEDMRSRGLYTRVHHRHGPNDVLWDVRSNAPMSTEFALTRFLTPTLAKSGWALFMDCDVMARADLKLLFDQADSRYAVMVVKHDLKPAECVKMDGQTQTNYYRKNWSSVMLFNCDHPANIRLSPSLVNEAGGLYLHQFGWLEDHLIGELHPTWNHLVGVDQHDPLASLVHFTLGLPRMPGYEDCEFADEWRGWL